MPWSPHKEPLLEPLTLFPFSPSATDSTSEAFPGDLEKSVRYLEYEGIVENCTEGLTLAQLTSHLEQCHLASAERFLIYAGVRSKSRLVLEINPYPSMHNKILSLEAHGQR